MTTCKLLMRCLMVSAVALAGHGAGAAQLVIAQVTGLSGLEAVQGRAYSAGLQLALTNANKAGGTAGHTFTLVRKDDGGRPEDTLTATTQLLTESKPIALAGYFGNRGITELLKSGVLAKEKIALVGYRTTDIQADVPYLYNVRAGLRDEINKIADHFATVGIKRLGLLYEDSVGAAALTAAVDEITKRTGTSIVVRATYPAGTARIARD
jgi:branched-chain amino acid transport system substrate-binding protein